MANAKRKFVETVEAHVNLVLITSSDQLDCQGCCVFAEGTAADGSPELQEQILWVWGDLRNSHGKRICKLLGPLKCPMEFEIGWWTSWLGARICHQCVSGAIKQQNVDIDFKIDKTAIVHVGLGKGLRTEETTREERRGEKKRRRANSGCLRRGLEMASLPLGPHNPQEHEMTQRLTLVGRRQRRRKLVLHFFVEEWPVAGHIISTTIGGKNGEAKQVRM
ncbi:hypothetical protein HPP92_020037 [Vanilla planifolia]|uniref:Uncharacterized protein n=1 Tax=Vanilla planifolia TaxID=51239 RepID=A0A835Q7N3_VANPL|nr:hypothetical protein HPP92_020037 [Vanilla planifolia]